MSLKQRIISEIRRASYPVQSGQLYLRTSPELLADKIVTVLQATNAVPLKSTKELDKEATPSPKGTKPRG